MSEIKVEIEYIVKGDNITAIAYPQKNNFSNNNNNGSGGKPFVLGATR